MKKNKKILLITLMSVIGGLNDMMAQENKTDMEKKKVTAGREAWNDFAPKFAEMNDDILFGEIWSREKQLSSRDRSLITVSALFGRGEPNVAYSKYFVGQSYLASMVIPTAADSAPAAIDRAVSEFQGFLDCLENPKERGGICGGGVWNKGEVKSKSLMQEAYNMGV